MVTEGIIEKSGNCRVTRNFARHFDLVRSYLKKLILVQGQGGRYIQTVRILWYFEELNLAPNAEIGPKDFFEMVSTGDSEYFSSKFQTL